MRRIKDTVTITLVVIGCTFIFLAILQTELLPILIRFSIGYLFVYLSYWLSGLKIKNHS